MQKELSKYGLSNKEIEIYLACLKAGNTTANRLSELTGIRRSTVYEIIDSLKKKGLISSFSKNKKFYFSAAKPSTLLDLLKEKERTIKGILPELNKIISTTTEKPKIELFEGIIGIKNAVEEMLGYKEILIYGASVVADSILGPYTSNYAKRRVEKKIMMKAIIEKQIPEHMLKKDVARFTQIKTLDFLKNHKGVYFIYGSKVIIITLDEEIIAIRITSPILVESQKIIFNFLWNLAKAH